MPQTVSTRRCRLLLGAAGLAGGRPVDEVEAELRRMGAVLGVPDAQCAATPTGLFVSLRSDEAAGFQSVGAPLRFDQSAEISRSSTACWTASWTPTARPPSCGRCSRRLPLVSRWAAAAGLVPVTLGIGLILQPSPANLVAAEADLLEGPLRTLLPPLAVLLPGALIVTGTSELAAGAMVAGTARLVFGSVQLLLFTFGLLAAVRVVGISTADPSNIRVDDFGWWRRGPVCCCSGSACA